MVSGYPKTGVMRPNNSRSQARVNAEWTPTKGKIWKTFITESIKNN